MKFSEEFFGIFDADYKPSKLVNKEKLYGHSTGDFDVLITIPTNKKDQGKIEKKIEKRLNEFEQKHKKYEFFRYNCLSYVKYGLEAFPSYTDIPWIILGIDNPKHFKFSIILPENSKIIVETKENKNEKK